MLEPTIDELRSIALAAPDASGYFPAMYARVTDQIRTAVDTGRFDDDVRMERFAHAFARWYLRARSDPASAPACWRASFDVAGDGDLMIVQHLLLGINAHVNHDLPQVVVELAPAASDLASLRADFDAVNDILAETLPMVLQSLGRVSRWVNLIAARTAGRVFDFSLDVARAQAWSAAERLHRADDDVRRTDVAELDRVVASLALMVASPGRPLRWGVGLGRRLEEHDHATVVGSLLGPLA